MIVSGGSVKANQMTGGYNLAISSPLTTTTTHY